MRRAAPTLVVRADASSALGTGHVMRTLALAQAALDAGGGAAFALAAPSPKVEQLLRGEALEVVHLDAAPGSQADATALCALARARGAAVVLDGYQFDAAYQRRIKAEGLYLCCIDDYGHAGEYAADLVVNQDVFYADAARYPGLTAEKLLLGAPYALIRREFRVCRPASVTVPDVARRILLTMGGSDNANLTGSALEDLETLAAERVEVTAVVGGANLHWPALQVAAARSQLGIRLLRNVDDMPERMSAVDLAVSAGGMTSYELAFMGVPAVLVAAAETQAPSARVLHEAGVCHFAGRGEDLKRGAVAGALRALMMDAARRRDMALRGRKMFDGGGAGRVLQAIATAVDRS